MADEALLVSLATSVAKELRSTQPGISVTPYPTELILQIDDRANRLTYVAGVVQTREDRRLGISILTPADSEVGPWPVKGQLSPYTLDDVTPGRVEPAEWIASRVIVLRDAANTAREAARARKGAHAREVARAQEQAQAREAARVRHEAELRAEAEATARYRAIARRREEAEQRRIAAEAQAARKQALVGRLEEAFESDYLSADQVLTADPDRAMLSSEGFEQLKATFVRSWAARVLSEPLDDEQAAAVAATAGDVQVVARAGSGKTRTLVTRAIFLQKHCRVRSHELLLLAFNKKAAEEMKSRLGKALGEDLPHVMTFHALAHALVHPDQDLVYDDGSSGQLGRSREVQEVIDEHMRSSEHRDRIRDLMLAHFREDWERIVEGRFELTIDEFLAYRRALPRESLNGEFVKSYGERAIANVLFEHGIKYKYEKSHRWNGVNYRPDFTIETTPRSGVVIEYFGLAGEPDYDEMSEAKRAYWANQGGWRLLEYSPRDLARNGARAFAESVVRDLRELGISLRLRSDEEIWQAVRMRAVDRFTGAITGFVGRCRKRNLSPDDLKAMVARHRPCTTAEGQFLEVGQSVYAGYLTRLTQRNIEDFDGLMWRAVASVREGQTQFVRDRGKEQGDLARLRFVMIDEFQDFSDMFFELIQGIRSASPKMQLFCVGDAWQAINGFAGADLRFFANFAVHFRDTTTRYISTNYRSAAAVVRMGNALMHGRGVPARAASHDEGTVWLCPLDKFNPSTFELSRHTWDELTPAVLRLARKFLDEGADVVMLSRRHGVVGDVNYADAASESADARTRFLEHIRSFLPEDDRGRVTASTTHGFKGLERSAVIVLDAFQGSYPLIHPNWVFLRVFGDTLERIEDEERRLFYVAITRAKDSLALVTETRRESPYVVDIERHEHLVPVPWTELSPVPSLQGARLEVRVYDGYEVRDKLKDLKYSWNNEGRYWRRAVVAEGFSFEALLGQSWASANCRIAVHSESGDVTYERNPEPKTRGR